MQFRARRWAAVISAIFSFLLAANTSQASVVLLDTLTGTPFDQSNAYSIFNIFGNSQSVAVPFTSTNAWTITSIDTLISAPFGGTIDFGIMADSNDHPSGQFLSKVTLDPTADPLSLSSLAWSIDAGSKYWLAAISTGEDVTWVFDKDVQGTLGIDGGSGWTTEANFLPAALIRAELTSETPLPGALVLFASGLGGFGVFGLRRKRKESSDIAA